jgi:nitroreductase
MEIMELIASRKSVRNYLSDPIPKEVLDEILEAGRLAPSAQNGQPWRYVVLTDREEIKKLVYHCGLIGLSNFFLKDAPCVIVACADRNKNRRINAHDYYLVDTAISFHQMILTAWSHGIASCWMAAFSEKVLHKYLKLPKSWRIVAISPFGYPADKGLYAKALGAFSGSKERFPLDKIVTFGLPKEKPDKH